MKWHHWYETEKVNLRHRRQTYCRLIYCVLFYFFLCLCLSFHIPISISLCYSWFFVFDWALPHSLLVSISFFLFSHSRTRTECSRFIVTVYLVWLLQSFDLKAIEIYTAKRKKEIHSTKRKEKNPHTFQYAKKRNTGRTSAYRKDDRRHPRRHITTPRKKRMSVFI